jgi:hypothetical protein
MNTSSIVERWKNIKIYFEKEHFTSENFICDDINIYMSKYKNQNENELLLSLSCLSKNINNVINNLPDNVDILLLEVNSYDYTEIFLKLTLKNISI